MTDRIRSGRQAVCSDDAFHAIFTAANGQVDRVEVPGKLLSEIMDCHARCGGKVPRDLQGSGWRKVDRKVLFDFMVDHGECCGTQVDGDWVSSRARRDQRLGRVA